MERTKQYDWRGVPVFGVNRVCKALVHGASGSVVGWVLNTPGLKVFAAYAPPMGFKRGGPCNPLYDGALLGVWPVEERAKYEVEVLTISHK